MIAARFSPKKHARTPRIYLSAALLSALLICAAGCDPSGPPKASKAGSEATTPEAAPTKTVQPDPPAQADAPQSGPAVPGLAEATDTQQMLLLEAKKAFLTDDIGRGGALFDTLVKSKPVSGAQVSAVIALAQIYNETGRPDEAVRLYDELSEEVSGLPETQLAIARAYTDLAPNERAISAYQKPPATQPDPLLTQPELGNLHAQTGQNDAAAHAIYAYQQQIYKMATQL